MADLVEVVVDDSRWDAFGLDAVAERAARATLRHLGMAPDGFLISVLGCADARIAALNAHFRDMPRPTNVLSWPSADRTPATLPAPGTTSDPKELGDIAIAWETCAAEADAGGLPLADHVTHLIVHAVLHLLGYDHEDDREAAVMAEIEVAILARVGVADPYS